MRKDVRSTENTQMKYDQENTFFMLFFVHPPSYL